MRPGRAVVVILKGTRRAPEIVLRHEIDLADAWIRESLHPYHQELGDRGSAGEQARRRGCKAACHAAQRAVHTLLDEMRCPRFRAPRRRPCARRVSSTGAGYWRACRAPSARRSSTTKRSRARLLAAVCALRRTSKRISGLWRPDNSGEPRSRSTRHSRLSAHQSGTP